MLRFDDQFPLHRKVDGLTDSAFRMHVEAIFWSARNLTDGFITQDDLTSACRYRKPEGYLAQVVKRGAWHRIAGGQITGCPQCEERYANNPIIQGDGWLIHGFLDWQLARSKVLHIKDARARAGKLGGQRSGATRRAKSGGKSGGKKPQRGGPKPQPNSAAEANGKQQRSKPGSRSNEPPIPSPSKEGNRGSAPASPGDARSPTKPAVGSPPNGEIPDPDRRKELAQQARAQIRKPRLRPSRDPFTPPDKAQSALDALDAALEELPSPQPEEAHNDRD